MRKASLDGDSLSVTSGADTENKTMGIAKLMTKRTSLKRTVQNLSQDADDGVAEPLLQNDKAKIDFGSQTAKFVLSKLKTSSICEQDDEESNLVTDNKKNVQTSVQSVIQNLTDNSLDTTALIHNQMYNQAFQSVPAPQNHDLVDIDSTKSKTYTPTSMIFTTAKIHFEGTTKLMEPLHVTPVPIASTIEDQAGNKKVITKNSEISELKLFQKDRTGLSSISTVSDPYYSGLVQSGSTSIGSDKDLEKSSNNKIKINVQSTNTSAPKTLYTITEATTVDKGVKPNVSMAKSLPTTSKDTKHGKNDEDKNASNETFLALQKKQSQESIQGISALPHTILANSSSKKTLLTQHTQRDEEKLTVSNKDLKKTSELITSQVSTKEKKLVTTKTVLESTSTDFSPTAKTSSNVITTAPIHSEIVASSVAIASKLPVSTFKSTHVKSTMSETKSSVPNVTLKHQGKSSTKPPAKTMTTKAVISPVTTTGLKTKPTTSTASVSAKSAVSQGKPASTLPPSSTKITRSTVPETKTSIPVTSSTPSIRSKTTGKNVIVKAPAIKTTANPLIAPKAAPAEVSKPTEETK